MPDFESSKLVKIDGVWHIEGKPREDFKILKSYKPSNIPGKTILVGSVDVPPNGATPSHKHGGAAIVAIPIGGTCLNQMNNNEPIVSSVGDFWYEAPGCHHQRSENVGKGNAKFMVVLIVDDETIKDGYENIFVLDREVEAGERAASK